MAKTYSLLDVLPIHWHNRQFIEETSVISEKADQPNNESFAIDEKPYVEGSLKEVVLSVHERNPIARRKCIEYYGPRCYICQFDFADRYGSLFEGLIHVHHRNPLFEQSAEYIIDPISDLIPVCPNCHMVLHSKADGVYTPEEIIEFLSK